jgi:hypothetical protein
MTTNIGTLRGPYAPHAPTLPHPLGGLRGVLDRVWEWLDTWRCGRADAKLRRWVLRELRRERLLEPFWRLRTIDAVVRDAMVRLEGYVNTPAQAQLAERRAWSVPGVRVVQSRLVDDETLEYRIAHALLRDPVARAGSIRATSWVGAVTLDGEVPTEEVRRRALEVARETPGVVAVQDQLRIRPDLPDQEYWWLNG